MLQQTQTEFAGFRQPGIRLNEPLLPNVTGHSSEAELPILYAYHMFDKAHLVMLAEEELIRREDVVAMLKSLREMEAEGVEKVRLEVGGGMHSAEHYLIRKLGENVGGRIHLGRSSGDLGAVGRNVRQRDDMLVLMDEINKLRKTVIDVAEDNFDAVMPGYTHAQHAQPVTLGHVLLSWAAILERDNDRAAVAYRRANQSPAGAAIMTGSNFPLNRHRTAELLGFDGIIRNTFDAILSQDVPLDTFFAIASVNANMSRWAYDLSFWFTSEAGYIDIPDRFCGTSSIMMQKKNPYALEYLRGAAAESIGGIVTGFTALKAGIGDAVMDRRYLFEAMSRSLELAIRGLDWYAQLLPAIKVKKDRMRAMAGSYWAQATDVAGTLVREKDLPWRTSHQIVGILVRHAYEQGKTPQDTTPADIDAAALEYMGKPLGISKEALDRALDPVNFVNSRTLHGGPAPEEGQRTADEFRGKLDEDLAAVRKKRKRLATASEKLEKAIDALLG